MKYALVLILLLVCAGVEAQMIKDTLFLLNGSKIVGKIKKIKLGVMDFDPDDANDITVQLQKLDGIYGLSKIFRVETIDERVVFGKILPCGEGRCAEVVNGLDTLKIQMEHISQMYPFRNSFWQRFSGNASAGFDYTRSSDLGRISLDGVVNYAAKKLEISFTASGIYTLEDSAISRDREDVALKYNHYFTTTWFATTFLRSQRNLELGLLRRYQEGFGAGNKFVKTRIMYAWTRAGLVLNQEKNTEEEKSGTLAELFSQWEFNFFRFAKPKVTFNVAETFYYSLSQKDRLRNDLQMDISWEIVKDLNLTLSGYWNLDSQPPSETSQKSDYGTVFRIGVIF
jgi:hypothetical protein